MRIELHENKYWLKIAKKREMTFNKKLALSHPATRSLKKSHRRWKVLADFERRQKESFLSNLTVNDSLKIFLSLYQFDQKISHKAYYKKLDLEKIKNLSRVHSMFNKAGRVCLKKGRVALGGASPKYEDKTDCAG